MLLAGIKFGFGLWLASMMLIALATLLVGIHSSIDRYHMKRVIRLKQKAPKAAYLLRAEMPESEGHKNGTHIFLFRTSIRWGSQRAPYGRNKESQHQY